MSLASLLPDGVSVFTLAALMAVALVASVARGFSGFGAALIFMPLASTVAPPRIVAALLLVIDLVAAAPFALNAWKQGDRKAVSLMAFGASGAAQTRSMINSSAATVRGAATVLASGMKISAEPKPEKPRAMLASKATAIRATSVKTLMPSGSMLDKLIPATCRRSSS